MKEDILIKTATEYYSSALEEHKKARYNASLVLFFKALIALTDLYILQKTKNTPSSHASRFQITKKHFPEVYDLLDKDFPFYQDSYVQIMSKELAEAIKDDVQIMAEKTRTKI
jgi:hypothetical protein